MDILNIMTNTISFTYLRNTCAAFDRNIDDARTWRRQPSANPPYDVPRMQGSAEFFYKAVACSESYLRNGESPSYKPSFNSADPQSIGTYIYNKLGSCEFVSERLEKALKDIYDHQDTRGMSDAQRGLYIDLADHKITALKEALAENITILSNVITDSTEESSLKIAVKNILSMLKNIDKKLNNANDADIIAATSNLRTLCAGNFAIDDAALIRVTSNLRSGKNKQEFTGYRYNTIAIQQPVDGILARLSPDVKDDDTRAAIRASIKRLGDENIYAIIDHVTKNHNAPFTGNIAALEHNETAQKLRDYLLEECSENFPGSCKHVQYMHTLHDKKDLPALDIDNATDRLPEIAAHTILRRIGEKDILAGLSRTATIYSVLAIDSEETNIKKLRKQVMSTLAYAIENIVLPNHHSAPEVLIAMYLYIKEHVVNSPAKDSILAELTDLAPDLPQIAEYSQLYNKINKELAVFNFFEKEFINDYNAAFENGDYAQRYLESVNKTQESLQEVVTNATERAGKQPRKIDVVQFWKACHSDH